MLCYHVNPPFHYVVKEEPKHIFYSSYKYLFNNKYLFTFGSTILFKKVQQNGKSSALLLLHSERWNYFNLSRININSSNTTGGCPFAKCVNFASCVANRSCFKSSFCENFANCAACISFFLLFPKKSESA